MSEVIIPRPKELKEKKAAIQKAGAASIHILADFDRTLTKYKIGEREVPSAISLLRTGDYLGEVYATAAHALFDKYHPIEVDTSMTTEEKKKAMETWWEDHFELLIKSGLNKRHLEKIVRDEGIEFRLDTKTLFERAHAEQIPLVIMSSSGVGDTIPLLLARDGLNHKNVYVITNRFEYAGNGDVVGIKRPIIHGMNKDETPIQDHPDAYAQIQNRKNVILLGDSLSDKGMVTGFEYENLIAIGFINKDLGSMRESFEKEYDIIIPGDSDMTEVNKLLEELTQ